MISSLRACSRRGFVVVDAATDGSTWVGGFDGFLTVKWAGTRGFLETRGDFDTF